MSEKISAERGFITCSRPSGPRTNKAEDSAGGTPAAGSDFGKFGENAVILSNFGFIFGKI